MFDVSLTIPDLDCDNPEQAARLFLEALLSADWSGGMTFTVQLQDGIEEKVKLDGKAVHCILDGKGK